MSLLRSMAVGAVLSALGVSSAQAVMITYDWEGSVTGSAVAQISSGSTITGQFSYDNSITTPTSTASVVAFYSPNATISFSVAGLNGTFSNSGIAVFNSNYWNVGDQFDFRQGSGTTYTGDQATGRGDPTQLFFRLNDVTRTTFSDTSLPQSIDFADFASVQNSRIDGWGVTFRITGLNERSTSVPEPASIALMSLGLIGSGFARRKKAA